MKKVLRKISKNSGATMLTSIVFFLFVSLAVISGLVTPSVREFRSANLGFNSKKSLLLAESGVEDVVYRTMKGMSVDASETLSIGDSSTTTTTANLPGGIKRITSHGNVSNNQRRVEFLLSAGTGVSFNYGVHVGTGGITMGNNAKVIGNAYSNGNIIGSGGATITGSATVSGATGKIDNITVQGNADAHFLEDITVGGNSRSSSLLRGTISGNVISDSISSCTIFGNATYDTKSSCTISGAQSTPNPTDYTDPPVLPFPILDDQIAAWEEEAAAGGTISSKTYSSGTRNLGPVKINGDLVLNNTAEVVMTGTIWVTGNIYLNNSSTIRLSPSYGGFSGVLMAGVKGSSSAGQIELNNSSKVFGSGQTGSYLMLLSQRVGPNDAIDLENNISGGIAFAPYGTVEVANDAGLIEITAWRIDLDNNATITYQSGVSSLTFSSGPSGSWQMTGWKEK